MFFLPLDGANELACVTERTNSIFSPKFLQNVPQNVKLYFKERQHYGMHDSYLTVKSAKTAG